MSPTQTVDKTVRQPETSIISRPLLNEGSSFTSSQFVNHTPPNPLITGTAAMSSLEQGVDAMNTHASGTSVTNTLPFIPVSGGSQPPLIPGYPFLGGHAPISGVLEGEYK